MLPTHVADIVMLSRREAATYLGVGYSTLANWASTGKVKLKYYRVGKAVKYRKSDLDAFIENNQVT